MANDSLSNLLSQNIRAQLAGAGGYGQNRGFLNGLGDVVSFLGSIPQSGLVGGAANVINRRNVRDYNRALQSNAMAKMAMEQEERQYQRTKDKREADFQRQKYNDEQHANAVKYENYKRTLEKIDPRLKDTYLSPEDYDKFRPGFENGDFNTAAKELQEGRLPTTYGVAKASEVRPVLQDILDRQKAISDADASNPLIHGMNMNGGFFEGRLGPPVQTPAGPAQMQQDPVTYTGGPIEAGVSQNSTGGISPYTIGVMDPKLLQTTYQGLETKRHNQASEKAAMKNADAAYMKAQKYQPSGGGHPPQPTKASIAASLFADNPDAMTQFLMGNTVKPLTGTAAKTLGQLKTAIVEEQNKMSDLWPWTNPDQGRIDFNTQLYNSMAQTYGQPAYPVKQQSVPVQAPKTKQTFKGQSQQKLDNLYGVQF